MSARTPVVWIVFVVAVFGLFTTVRGFAAAVRVFPGPAVLALVFLLLTGAVGWLIFTRMRPLARPALGWGLAAIGWGMTAATGCAILANASLGDIWAKAAGVDFASSWGAALTAPINEETLKLAGVVLLAIAVPALIRTPIDGFVVGALTGLGFQIAENWTYAINAILLGGGTDGVGSVVQSFAARVLLSGIGSHWAMSAVAGTGIGYLVTGRRRTGVRLVVLAFLMHTAFDAPVLGGLGILLKSLINFSVALTVYRTARDETYAAARQFPPLPNTDLRRRTRRRELRVFPPGPERRRTQHAQQDLMAQVADYVYR